jgi:hypothetical protein
MRLPGATCVAAIMAEDPDDLRRRADRYERLAREMIDDNQAVQALEAMAREIRDRADEIEAANQKASGSLDLFRRDLIASWHDRPCPTTPRDT